MSRLPKPFPECEQKHVLCFAYHFRKCAILNQTDFTRFCPFYKTRKEYHNEREKYGKEKDPETY